MENGKWINLEELYTPEIINLKSDKIWESNNLCLHLNFDFKAHGTILVALREVIRQRVPEGELLATEEYWKEEDDPGMLLFSICWDDNAGFDEICSFLDEINLTIAPILNECDGEASGDWFLNDDPLGVATWIWTNEGFRIVGTVY